jgi:hypothetical protein
VSVGAQVGHGFGFLAASAADVVSAITAQKSPIKARVNNVSVIWFGLRVRTSASSSLGVESV